RGGGDALAQRGDDSTRHEHELRHAASSRVVFAILAGSPRAGALMFARITRVPRLAPPSLLGRASPGAAGLPGARFEDDHVGLVAFPRRPAEVEARQHLPRPLRETHFLGELVHRLVLRPATGRPTA